MSENKRQVFVFWQFNGNNKSQCNQTCPYCYGGEKENQHYFNGDVAKWEKAFVRLDKQHGNSGLYLVMSYGESMTAKGFYECVEMIGKHPTWTLSIVTNLSMNPTQLVQSQLGREKRVFVNTCWHPLGVPDPVSGWEIFKKHLLMLKVAGVPVHVLFLWYPSQIHLFPQYFDWLDSHNFRVSVRRFFGNVGGVKLPFMRKVVGGKNYPKDYSKAAHDYIYASTCPKVTLYGLDIKSPKGLPCSAGKDLILVKYDGTVKLCADCENCEPTLGNIFSPDFKLNSGFTACPSNVCGGDYGMLHLEDSQFGPVPDRLERDTFVSIVEGIRQASPVPYSNRTKMLECLERIRNEHI